MDGRTTPEPADVRALRARLIEARRHHAGALRPLDAAIRSLAHGEGEEEAVEAAAALLARYAPPPPPAP